MTEAKRYEEDVLNARIDLDRVTRYPEDGWQDRLMSSYHPLAKHYGIISDDLWSAWSKHNVPGIVLDSYQQLYCGEKS